DKPPLGFWIQVLSTKIFGFSGFALVLPQAIASVIAVYLIYKMINKRFSKGAALVGAAILALTPIFVAVSRNNTIDAVLILLMVLAAHQALLAAERASIKHLIFAGVFIGLGFNVKMLQAYMIVPAIYLTYLIFAKQKFFKKVLVCAVSVIVMAAISLSWVAIVDMTPEDSRPYIGSSDSNSALDLALGYNGLSRIINQRSNTAYDDGQNVLPSDDDNQIYTDIKNRKPPIMGSNQNPPIGDQQSKPPINNMTSGKGAGGESGETGIFRLFNEQNAGQISWFIVPSVFTVLLMLYLIIKGKFKSNPKNIALLFFVLCFVPILIYFSFSSGISHRYYFATLAPFMAALSAIGYYYMMEGRRHWIAIVFAAAAGAQIYIQYLYKGWIDCLVPIMIAVFGIALLLIIIGAIKKAKKTYFVPLLCTLLILPAVWSLSPMIYNDNSQLPIAGPELVKENDRFDDDIDLSSLIEYLEENREGAAYLAVTSSSMDMGAEIILSSGEPVIALGGFNGGDSTVTLDEFIAMVDDNQVRYAYIGNISRGSNLQIYNWIKRNGTIVRPSEYGGMRMNNTLYKIG
ncbi:MAG: glycosyltransferase family 39 protein, partial [Eubacteriales bacterium]